MYRFTTRFKEWGSVASDSGKLAQPVLPDTEVASPCSACGIKRTLLQNMPFNAYLHSYVHGMQAAPAIHCSLALPRQSAAKHTQEAPSSTHQGRGAGSAPHRKNKLPCLHLSFHGATNIIKKLIKIPLQLALCEPFDTAASWNGLQMYCKVPKAGHFQTLDPSRPSTRVLMKFALTGAVPEA
eukprot:1138563-Pelagomonas_calceolata.AAC.4